MFTIVISEKGGAERKEAFDKNEINVGRVQGNDLMLPKGNVSKHHARLLFRDGRFIVTDLKSTNGTYVNGRKISQATIVREGDKIYVGDFVLRLESAASASADDSTASRGKVSTRDAVAVLQAPPTAEIPAAALMPRASISAQPPPPPPLPAAGSPPVPPPLPAAATSSRSVSGSPPASPQAPHAAPQLSHYPLERDPDSESAPEMPGAPVPKVPGAPRLPQQTIEHQQHQPQPPPQPRARAASLPTAERAVSASRRSQSAPVPRGAAVPEARPSVPREAPHHAARRLALITLVDRVADVLDLGALARAPVVDDALAQQIDRAVREQARAMRSEGEAPDGVDLDGLARDAMREFVGLGPIGPLLDDDEISEVQVLRPDFLVARRAGSLVVVEPAFTSEEVVARIVSRLAHQSGEAVRPEESVVERRLARGAHLVAIAPSVAPGWVFSVHKRRRIEASLDELVRSGGLSRSMAVFLETCVTARANILVAGSGSGTVPSMIGALASAIPAGERVAMLHDVDEIAIPQAQVTPLTMADSGKQGADAVRAGARLGLERLVVVSLTGAVALATVDAVGEGSEALIAGVGAPSLRHGLARLVSQVAMARPGASLEAAREAVGESFDVAVEVVQSAPGSLRVSRIAELEGGDTTGVVGRDLFIAEADREGHWAFTPTGAIPRLTTDFAARGVRIDPALFRGGR
jgi:pilus assembly protein CpaF